MPDPEVFKRYPKSVVTAEGTLYALERKAPTGDKYLLVHGKTGGFIGMNKPGTQDFICELSAYNACELRRRLTWLKAVPLGLKISVGMGDRLGLATPGHAAAVEGTGIAPIFAQQSVRENTRTGRTPQEVMDDAMWGVFQSGWREPWGGDADHLKRLEDLDGFVAAGYTFFTVDPGDFVDQTADNASLNELRSMAEALPWGDLDTNRTDLLNSLVGKTFQMEGFVLTFDEATVLRAAVKYGPSVAHAVHMYARLNELLPKQAFDFEVSVDETATPTSIHEHFFIAHELQRAGVRWTSLAPRFVGRFEKGVDFIGDLAELDATLAQHAAVMRYFGSYKLSLHSGSDKFSVYPIVARHSRGLVHLKTAGTSYLEALRVIAMVDPDFFRRIYTFSREHYETDRASYHVSAELTKTPAHPTDAELPGLLDQFDARQVLHVTFGSVLDLFRAELYQVLREHESEYTAVLKTHLKKHLDPLIV